MLYTVAMIIGILGQLSTGVPLEDSLVHLENPSLRLENPSVSLEDPLVRLEDPSDLLSQPSVRLEHPSVGLDYPLVRLDHPSVRRQHLKDPLVDLDDPSIGLEDPSTNFTQFFDSRIVGGTEASKNRAPHMVALVVGHTFKSLVCGASVIGKCLILTAAHCVTSFIQWDGGLMYTFHGRVGTNTWHEGTVVDFKSYHIHPDYNAGTLKNDVAVLKSRGLIPLSEKVAIIALNFDWVGGGQKCYVTGWGTDRLWGNVPDLLQILHVWTLSPKECQERAAEAHAVGWWSPYIDPKLEICTFHSLGHGMCHGDSGSALVCFKKTQCGVVSWGFPCAVNFPDVFVRVKGMEEFLLAIIKKGCIADDHCP